MTPAPNPKTEVATSSSRDVPIRQLSVFLQNRAGSLLALVKLLGDHHIVVMGLSLQETTELALVRLIVSAPKEAELLFIEKGIPHAVTPVTVIELGLGDASLPSALSALLAAEVNISFSYSLLIRPGDHPALVLHLDSPEFASGVLTKAGFKVLKQQDLLR